MRGHGIVGGTLVAVLLVSTESCAGRAVFTPAAITKASTDGEYEAFAKAYDDEATAFENSAKTHAAYAAGSASPKGETFQANHCYRIATSLRAAAAESRAIAAEKRQWLEDMIK